MIENRQIAVVDLGTAQELLTLNIVKYFTFYLYIPLIWVDIAEWFSAYKRLTDNILIRYFFTCFFSLATHFFNSQHSS